MKDDVARQGSHPVRSERGSDLSSLLERVREATGPDRELDAAIAVALQIGARKNLPDDLQYLREASRSDECAPGTYWFISRSGMSLRTAENYTASLDAALSLVERRQPGESFNVLKEAMPLVWKRLWPERFKIDDQEQLRRLPLAICEIVVSRALLETQAQEPGQ